MPTYLTYMSVFLAFFLLCGPQAEGGASVSSDTKVDEAKDFSISSPLSITGRIALISPTRLQNPGEVAAHRHTMFERIGIRGVLSFHRRTGFALDSHPLLIPGIGFLCLALGIWCLFKSIRLRRYLITSIIGVVFMIVSIAAGVTVYQLYELEKHDLNDAANVLQGYVDVFAGRALDFEIITDWDSFASNWAAEISNGRLPYSVIAWAGEPVAGSAIDTWIKQHSRLSILHVGLGPALPPMLREVIFRGADSWLEWNEDSPQRITDPRAQRGRGAYWRSYDQSENFMRAVFDLNKKEISFGSIQGARIFYARNYDSNEDLMAFDEQLWREMSQLPSAFTSAHLQKTGVLRLDDPGASQNAFLEPWLYPELTVSQWHEITEVLKRQKARMSVGVVLGWVDDGNYERGDLWVRGRHATTRKPGRIYPSRWVRYKSHATGWLYDVEQQMRFFQTDPRSLDFEIHGYAHMTPEIDLWLNAADRYKNENWYREFLITHTQPYQQQSVQVQNNILDAALKSYRELFDFQPSTLIPPGHKQSLNTAELARAKNYRLVSSGNLTILRQDHLSTSRVVEIEDFANSDRLVGGGFPMILYLHDRDLALHSPQWFESRLKDWRHRGVERFITLRELAVRLTVIPEVTYYRRREVLRLSLKGDMQDRQHLSRALGNKLDFWLQIPNGCVVKPAKDLTIKQGLDDKRQVLVEWQIPRSETRGLSSTTELPLDCK